MKVKLCIILLGVSLMSGCTRTARLYPVQGPLFVQTPSLVLLAKVTGAFNSGNITVALSDGEVCKGHWAVVPRTATPVSAPAVAAPIANSLSPVWDTVYGSGFFVSHVLGTRLYVRAVATGNRGTILNVEMYRPDTPEVNLSTVRGIAQDNKGNIYKLVF
jgi:hypothetical protein